MRIETAIDNRPVTLEMEQRNGRVLVQVDGRTYEVEVLRPEPGILQLMVGNEVFEARVWMASSGSLQVQLRDQIFSVEIIDRKHRRPQHDHGLEGKQQLTAPMPGKVIKVLVPVGSEVEAGQGVVVVEAMKMQNEVKSPKSGRVIEIRVSAGDTVIANQLLAIVE
ncbi:MAG TPA: biotin/lipoyl-containing protein [Blastocatellia bacterium]|nr:biotin/lipoyl-containing protein [Blastocatellia bacterium]